MLPARGCKVSRTKSLPAANGDSDNTVKHVRRKVTIFLVDVVARIVLGALFASTAGSCFANVLTLLRPISGGHLPMAPLADAISAMAIGFFSFSVACLYVVRRRSATKCAGWFPTLTAIAGSFLLWGLLWLDPRMDLSLPIKIVSAGLILSGNIFAVVSLGHLGRSFSILPEGRALVTSGPYRLIRHPVYAAEAVAALGVMLNFLSLAAIALVGLQFLLQFGRMRYEEKVLRVTFPEYAAYSRRTARLIPGVY
jgi:protein-S-isoprenylcysteine O-methyltransferase Ste14